MITRIWKMRFSTGVRFGTGGLSKGSFTMMADTVFSALCIEAAARKNGSLEKLVATVEADDFRISDLMPYIQDRYYLPKPMCDLPLAENSDSVKKKAMKKLTYVPADELTEFLKGTLNVEKESDYFRHQLGRSQLVQKAVITRAENNEVGSKEEDTKPYGAQVYSFEEGSGLYLLALAKTEEILEFVEDLLRSLGVTGIGGKISAGYGKFDLVSEEVPATLQERCTLDNYNSFMSLSCCLPKEQDLEQSLEGARYRLERRGGFVQSEEYAATPRKKREVFFMKAGSSFSFPFSGSILDVSEGGAHPVYRYAKPLWLGLK